MLAMATDEMIVYTCLRRRNVSDSEADRLRDHVPRQEDVDGERLERSREPADGMIGLCRRGDGDAMSLQCLINASQELGEEDAGGPNAVAGLRRDETRERRCCRRLRCEGEVVCRDWTDGVAHEGSRERCSAEIET